jgi:hypothetical protein
VRPLDSRIDISLFIIAPKNRSLHTADSKFAWWYLA